LPNGIKPPSSEAPKGAGWLRRASRKGLAAIALGLLFTGSVSVAANAGRVTCPKDDCNCYYNGEYKNDDYGHSYDGYTCGCNSAHKYWIRKEPPPSSSTSKVVCPNDNCNTYYNGEYKTDDYGHAYDGYTCSCNSKHKFWLRKN